MSKLYFRFGAMNCGKTTALLQVAHNYEEKGMKVIVIKSSIDKKGDRNIVSRLGIEREVDLLVAPNESILDNINLNNIVGHEMAAKAVVDFLRNKQGINEKC